jgi:hypothetical protein
MERIRLDVTPRNAQGSLQWSWGNLRLAPSKTHKPVLAE